MMDSQKLNLTSSPSKLQKYIFSWWKKNKRDLPWRHTHDPYKILVSEIMLQQTQVSRVLPKYEEFLYFFPDIFTLANASPAKVLRIWKGMGYNRRALYLQKLAKIIVQDFHGYFPISEQQLSKLPGVGTYTARAVLVFAYRENIALIDTNIRKIITHFFFNDTPQKESAIQKVADALLPAGNSWGWHQALMDYGALALPKHRTRNSMTRTPFRESNRFYRGRVVDRLREGAIHEKDLNVKPEIIKGLIKDGLVVRTKDNMVSLPS